MGQAGSNSFPGYLGGPRDVQVWYDDGTGGEWQDIDPSDNTRHRNYNNPSHPDGIQYGSAVGWGPGVEASYRFGLVYGAQNTRYIPVNYGGNSLGNWDNPSGPRWIELTTALTQGKAAVALQGQNWNVLSKLWVHGESDGTASKAPLYEAGMTDFIARVRALAEIPSDMPFYLCKLRRDSVGVDATYVPVIRAIQNSLAYNLTNVYLIEPENIGADLQGDNLHYTADGLVAIGQAWANHTVLTLSAEWQDLLSVYDGVAAATIMDNRYGQNVLARPDPATYAALFGGASATIGTTFRDPTFGHLIKVAATDISQLNSERPHQNADNTKWFFKTGTSRWEIFDNAGDKVGGNIDLRFEGQNPTDGPRWHPINPDIIFYPIDDHIIYYDTGASPPPVNPYIAQTSPHGTLGTNDRRMAGGDGNHAFKVEISPGVFEARILISHGKQTKIQVLVLDSWQIVRHNWTGSTWEESKVTWDVSSPHWDFPATSTDFDYASLTQQDENGMQFIMSAIDGQGTKLWNFNGAEIGQVDSNSNHMNQVKAIVGGTDYIATTKKTLAGMIPPAVNVGDIHCWYLDVDISVNPMALTVNGFVALDWDDGHHQSGGGQHSNFASNHSCLVALNSAEEKGAPDNNTYYSEIVELQLNRDIGDNTPRRGPHHMVNDVSPTSEQMEAWYSNDGTHFFYKSDIMGQLSGLGYLFHVTLPPRTPIAER